MWAYESSKFSFKRNPNIFFKLLRDRVISKQQTCLRNPSPIYLWRSVTWFTRITSKPSLKTSGVLIEPIRTLYASLATARAHASTTPIPRLMHEDPSNASSRFVTANNAYMVRAPVRHPPRPQPTMLGDFTTVGCICQTLEYLSQC